MEGNSTGSTKLGYSSNSSSYARSGKVMLSSVIITFSVVVIIVFFHSYARCIFLRRNRRRQLRLFLSDPSTTTPSPANPLQGLDVSVIKHLPTFLHSFTHDPPLQCAVCLSEFEYQEKGRVLPTCGHKFHMECIDMWLFSHSNCPLCRSPVVRPDIPASITGKVPEDFVISVRDEPAVSGAVPSSEQHQSGVDENGSSSSSPTPLGTLSPSRSEDKPLELVGVTVEQPSLYSSHRLEETCCEPPEMEVKRDIH